MSDWNKMVNLAMEEFRGISLCDNIGLITAYGSDLSYSDIFWTIHALMDEEDLLIAVSGSGNSINILKAIEAAKSKMVKYLV